MITKSYAELQNVELTESSGNYMHFKVASHKRAVLQTKDKSSPRRDIHLEEVLATIPFHVGGEVFTRVVYTAVTTESLVIGVEDDVVLARLVDTHAVISERVGWVDWELLAAAKNDVNVSKLTVEDKQQTGPLENNHLISLVLERNISLAVSRKPASITNLRGAQPTVLALQVVHGAVKLVKELVAEEVVINEVELATSMGERVAVALTREVHPPVSSDSLYVIHLLGMAELVALEVEVGLAAKSMCNESFVVSAIQKRQWSLTESSCAGQGHGR